MLPAHDEEGCIEAAVAACLTAGADVGLAFEVVVVDDGSRDATPALLDARAARDPRVRVIHLPENRGYGAALKTGLYAAHGDLVFFTDSDMQFDVGEVRRLLPWVPAYDIVVGYRNPRRDPLGRCVNGWAWSRLVGGLFGFRVRDVDCAFKLFDRRVFERISVASEGALVNAEILARALAAGFTLREVPVSHLVRTSGTSSGANPRVIARAFRELARFGPELAALRRSAAS